MNRGFHGTRVFTAILVLLASGSAGAVNLLTNPGFNSGTTGWALSDPGSATLSFDAADANGSPGSGSARIDNNSVGASNGTGIAQCAGSVTAGNNYTYGGKVLFPTGQNRTGSVQVGLRWWDGAGCTGSAISQPRLSLNAANAAWVSLDSGVQVAPVGSVSVQFVAFPSKVEAGGTLVGQFDDLYIDDGLLAQGNTVAVPSLSQAGLAFMLLLVGMVGIRLARRY
ncbi:MAG: hypothetical protein IPG66_13120 [Hydrogenophilales bacterium]|nr:hypothetical protein [Hydrogenophilales bacterium]